MIFHGEFVAGRMIQNDSNALVMNMNRVFSVIHEEELEEEEREKSIMGMRRNDLELCIKQAFEINPVKLDAVLSKFDDGQADCVSEISMGISGPRKPVNSFSRTPSGTDKFYGQTSSPMLGASNFF